jgi:hypothetical protein
MWKPQILIVVRFADYLDELEACVRFPIRVPKWIANGAGGLQEGEGEGRAKGGFTDRERASCGVVRASRQVRVLLVLRLQQRQFYNSTYMDASLYSRACFNKVSAATESPTGW